VTVFLSPQDASLAAAPSVPNPPGLDGTPSFTKGRLKERKRFFRGAGATDLRSNVTGEQKTAPLSDGLCVDSGSSATRFACGVGRRRHGGPEETPPRAGVLLFISAARRTKATWSRRIEPAVRWSGSPAPWTPARSRAAERGGENEP